MKFFDRIKLFFLREKLLRTLQQENNLLRDVSQALEVCIAVIKNQRDSQWNEAIKVLTAIVLQHGGEFTLDQTFLSLADENTLLDVQTVYPNDPTNRTTRYVVKHKAEGTPTSCPLNQVEDEGRCPDCGLRQNETCGNDCEACQ